MSILHSVYPQSGGVDSMKRYFYLIRYAELKGIEWNRFHKLWFTAVRNC